MTARRQPSGWQSWQEIVEVMRQYDEEGVDVQVRAGPGMKWRDDSNPTFSAIYEWRVKPKLVKPKPREPRRFTIRVDDGFARITMSEVVFEPNECVTVVELLPGWRLVPPGGA